MSTKPTIRTGGAPRKDIAVRKTGRQGGQDRPLTAARRPAIAAVALDAILADIAAGEPTRRVLAAHRISGRQFYGLLDSDTTIAERYARARASSMDAIADDAMRIADDPKITADQKRIMVDARKWFLSKLAPHKYGDRTQLEHSGGVETRLIISDD